MRGVLAHMSDMAEDRMAPAGEDLVSIPVGVESAKRRQILDGARQVFLSRGFDGASMGDIAKAAGVSKGTLYVYFDSKEKLFEALTIEEKECLAEAVFRLDADDADLRGALTRLGHSYLAMLGRPEHVSSIRMVIGTAEKFPRFGQMFYEAGPQNGIARLKAYLDRQVAAGRLSIGDTRLAAQHFIDLCQSGLMRRLLFAVGAPPTPDEISYLVDKAVWVFFKAYGPQE
jgi:AcrR family transcriptional regulator